MRSYSFIHSVIHPFRVTGSRAGAHSAGADGTTKSRAFSLFLAGLMLASVCLTFIPETARATPAYNVNTDLETGTVESWGTTGGGSLLAVDDVTVHAGSYSLKYATIDTSGKMATHSTTLGTTDDWQFSAWINVASSGAYWYLDLNTGATPLVQIRFSQAGEVRYYNSTASAWSDSTFDLSGGWNFIFVDCLRANSYNKFRLFINSGTNSRLCDDSGNGIYAMDTIQFGDMSGYDGTTLYFDDVRAGNEMTATGEFSGYSPPPSYWAPTITSTPTTSSRANITYSYHVTLNETSTTTASSLPSWASMCHNGTAGPWFVNGSTPWTSSGYDFKLKAQSGNGTLYAYQNWTVPIGRWAPSFASSPDTTTLKDSLYSYVPLLNETGTIQSVTLPNWGAFANGIVNGTPTENGAYNFSLRAVSTNGTRWVWQNWSVQVGGWAPVFINSPALSIIRGAEYSYTPLLNETGITTAITLPSWAHLINGTVNGTPTMLGVDNFGLKGTSTNGTLSAYKSWQVTVGGWAPEFTSEPVTTRRNNTVTFYEPTANETAEFNLIEFPIWAAQLNNGTVVYSPNEAGTFNFSLEATSTTGTLSVYQNWSVTIGAWVPSFETSPDTTAQLGESYSYEPELNESGTISIDTAPDWLAFEDGVLGGYPDASGEFNVSLMGNSTDGGLSSWQNWTISVEGSAPTIISTPSHGGVEGEFYQYSAAADQDNITWELTGSAWFLELNSVTGELTGIPDTAGIYSVHLVATNEFDLKAYQNWSITVAHGYYGDGGDNGNGNGGTNTNFFFNLSLDTWIVIGAAVLVLIAAIVLAGRRR